MTGRRLEDHDAWSHGLTTSLDDEHADAMAKVVHQAHFRRGVVLQLIQSAKNRGHRAYVNVDMEVEIDFVAAVDVEGNVDAVFVDFVDGCFFRRVFVRPATSLSTPVLIIDSVNTAMVYTYGSVVPLAFFSFNPLIF